MAYNLSSGADNLYKKLYSTVVIELIEILCFMQIHVKMRFTINIFQIPGNVECLPKNMLYSSKQHLFLVVFELSAPNGVVHEVVLYWEQTDLQSVNSRGSSVKGFHLPLSAFEWAYYAI